MINEIQSQNKLFWQTGKWNPRNINSKLLRRNKICRHDTKRNEDTRSGSREAP